MLTFGHIAGERAGEASTHVGDACASERASTASSSLPEVDAGDAPPTVADIGAASATLARPLTRPAGTARARSRPRPIDPRVSPQTGCRQTSEASATRARRRGTLRNEDDRFLDQPVDRCFSTGLSIGSLDDAAHDRGQRDEHRARRGEARQRGRQHACVHPLRFGVGWLVVTLTGLADGLLPVASSAHERWKMATQVCLSGPEFVAGSVHV